MSIISPFFFNHHFTVSIIPLKLQEHHLKIQTRECPSDFPVLQCKQTSDCVTDDGQSFTCGGEIVACDSVRTSARARKVRFVNEPKL